MRWLPTMQDQEREASVISEKMAEEGDVDGSMVKVAEAEALQQKWKELHESYTQPDRTMSVCEICGVFVQSTDNEQRRLVRALYSTAVSSHLLCENDSAAHHWCLSVGCACHYDNTGISLHVAKRNWSVLHTLICTAMPSTLKPQKEPQMVLPDRKRGFSDKLASQASHQSSRGRAWRSARS